MSDEFDANEFLSDVPKDDGPASGGALRKKLEEALALIKEQGKQIDSFKQKETKALVDQAWGKVPGEYRALYQGDQGDAEAIKSWVKAATTLGVIKDVAEGEAPGSEKPPVGNHADLQAFSDAAGIGTDGDPNGDAAFKAKAAEVKGKSAHKNPSALDELFALKPN